MDFKIGDDLSVEDMVQSETPMRWLEVELV
jgi:hypothetical protein